MSTFDHPFTFPEADEDARTLRSDITIADSPWISLTVDRLFRRIMPKEALRVNISIFDQGKIYCVHVPTETGLLVYKIIKWNCGHVSPNVGIYK